MAGSLLDTSDGSSLVDPRPSVKGTMYLMRHGRTAMDMGANRSDGWLDMPLTDEGRVKLIPAQQLLKTAPLTRIHAADLKRTKETAEIIQSGTLTRPEVVETPEARTWNLGILAGMRKEDGRPKVKLMKEDPSKRPLGGESYGEFRDRFLSWFRDELDEVAAGEQTPLLVLSGSTLRLIGLELFGDESATDLDEGGLAALHCVDGDWHCEVMLGHEDASPYES
jgi:broad specificity phosphatase PhoE